MQKKTDDTKLIKLGIFMLLFSLFLFIIIADICGVHILSQLNPTKILLYFLVSLWICAKVLMWAYKRKE